MKNIKILTVVIALTIISVSCVNNKEKKLVTEQETTVKLPYSIDLEKNLKSKEAVPLSQLATSVRYIPLETNPKSLLKKIDQIVFSKQYIFISDFNKLFQFDKTGRFIKIIGRNGNGPGEYFKVLDFAVLEESNQVILLDYSKQVEIYDFDGKFLNSFKWEYPSTSIAFADTNKLIIKLANIPNSSSAYNLLETDFEGKIIRKFNNQKTRKSKSGLIIDEIPFYKYKNVIKYLEFGSDTLFSIHDTLLEPNIVFHLGKMKMDSDPSIPFQNPERKKALDKLKEKLWITNLIESDSFLFITLNYGLSDLEVKFVFNKNSGELFCLSNNGLDNDIDGGVEFWPKYIYADSILVDYANAYVLLEHASSLPDSKKTTSTNHQFITLTKKINEESNPVLMVVNE